MRAADMFRRGKRQAEVARALGVSAETASEWYRLWSAGGRAALAGAGRAGRLPRVSDEQLAEVVAALKRGPRANGFPTDLWTLARAAEVIEAITGVRYSQTQTWEILRKRLGWTRQRPARRALERDDEAIATWVATQWPRIQKRPTPAGVDRLPRRIGVLPPPVGEGHLGAQGPDSRPAPSLRLDPAVHVGRPGPTSRMEAKRPDTIDEARLAAEAGLQRIGTSHQLYFNFLDHIGLSL
jgi:transposase